MNSLSAFDPLAWNPEALKLHPAYAIGNAAGWLARGDKQASTDHPLSGRLYLAKSGWLLLSVPNALVRGVFDAMTAPGAELPTAGLMNVPNVKDEVFNAHISVMTADEVRKIGADKITERGHAFGYTLGALKDIDVSNTAGVSKVWVIQVSSAPLAALRKTYGLSPLPNDEPFHITVAARRKHVLGNNGTSKGTGPTEEGMAVQDASRGELKAAADSSEKVNYECSCSGRCMCPDNCVGKKYGTCGDDKKTAADKLSGGEADNTPDSKFSPKALAEGTKHEHEHTTDNQIAKEIAKDHLSEDPRYYQKVRKIEAGEKTAEQAVLEALRQAKAHSDAKRYEHKNEILRRLIAKAPQDWEIDDPKPHHQGITHKPTKFRFHAERSVTEPLAKAAIDSVYGRELMNTLSLRRPIVYDAGKPVFENIKNQAAEIQRRGNFIMQANRNKKLYRAAIDPNYRYQQALKAFNGQLEQPALVDHLMEQYGDSMLGALGAPRR
jgi:hypothetical protein